MTKKSRKSKCCGAEVKADGVPDFIGSKEVCTVSFTCLKCYRPCDVTRLKVGKNRTRAAEKILLVMKVLQAKNGFILKATSAQGLPEEIVYQERYEDEVECFADFLRFLDEHFGPTTSRYSEKRIYVRVEQGDKYTKD